MNKYGMMMVCGNSVEELERDLAMLKTAIATGATMGCGGATLADVEKGIDMLKGNAPAVEMPHCRGCYCDPETYEAEDEDEDEAEDEDEETDSINEAYDNLVDHLLSMGLCSPTVHRLLEELADHL